MMGRIASAHIWSDSDRDLARIEDVILMLKSTNAPFYGEWEKIIPTEIIWVVRPQENFKSSKSTEAVSESQL